MITRLLISIFFFSIPGICDAQTYHGKIDTLSLEYDSLVKRRVYTFVDQMPEYPTGEAGFSKFFIENFRYPGEQDHFQGTINLVFVVMEDGSIRGERIPGKKPEEITLVDKEALRVLRKMPAWKAGALGEKKVPVKFQMPVRF